MLEVLKVPNTVLLINKGHVGGVGGVKHCAVLSTINQRLCMSDVSKVVFVAFT